MVTAHSIALWANSGYLLGLDDLLVVVREVDAASVLVHPYWAHQIVLVRERRVVAAFLANRQSLLVFELRKPGVSADESCTPDLSLLLARLSEGRGLRSERSLDSLLVVEPDMVLPESNLVFEQVLDLNLVLAIQVQVQDREDLVFEGVLVDNDSLEGAVLDELWLQSPPDHFVVIHLVALIVVSQVVEQVDQGLRLNAEGLFVAPLQEFE